MVVVMAATVNSHLHRLSGGHASDDPNGEANPISSAAEEMLL